MIVFCECVLPAGIYKYVSCLCWCLIGQKKALTSLKQELHTVLGDHVVARNQIQVPTRAASVSKHWVLVQSMLPVLQNSGLWGFWCKSDGTVLDILKHLPSCFTSRNSRLCLIVAEYLLPTLMMSEAMEGQNKQINKQNASELHWNI